MELSKAKSLFLHRNFSRFQDREWILEVLTVMESYTREIELDLPQTMEEGMTIDLSESTTAGWQIGDIVRVNKSHLFSFEPNSRIFYLGPYGDRPILHWLDTFNLINGTINFTNTPGGLLRTTVGIFLENFHCLYLPFGDKLQYVNGAWKIGSIRAMIAEGLLNGKLTVPEFERFIDQCYMLNHMTELCSPTLSPRSLVSHPDIPKVKAEFIAAHAGQMNDPMVAKELEDKVKALDKEWIGDDPSKRFFDSLGGNSWGIHRKKLFLTVGCIDSFDENSGNYEFIPNALTEGWTVDAMPTIINEIRKGSYSRGVETAKGGAETKFLMRVFQDLKLTEEDCHTTRGLYVNFAMYDPEGWLGCLAFIGDKQVLLTKENLNLVRGKIVKMRSPQTCETKNGMCYACAGQNFKVTNAEMIGSLVVMLSSEYMNLSMKNMHGTQLQTTTLSLEEAFI